MNELIILMGLSPTTHLCDTSPIFPLNIKSCKRLRLEVIWRLSPITHLCDISIIFLTKYQIMLSPITHLCDISIIFLTKYQIMLKILISNLNLLSGIVSIQYLRYCMRSQSRLLVFLYHFNVKIINDMEITLFLFYYYYYYLGWYLLGLIG
jgi:hypothetical protein